MISGIDIETTGLDPLTDKLLEVGIIITDDKLNEMARFAVCLDHGVPVEALIDRADSYVQQMHEENGLWEELRNGAFLPIQDAEDHLISLVARWAGADPRPLLAGSSVHFDRAWLKIYMPRLEALLHYRNLDVSTLKEAHRLFATIGEQFHERYPDQKRHRALVDLESSMRELRYYLSLMDWGGVA